MFPQIVSVNKRMHALITLSGKCLLDDVRLIGSEMLAPPTAGTFECSSTKPASYELGDS